MSRQIRHKLRSDTSDYHKGYADGMKAAFEESELDAYYTGVGYGKKQSGDKHIGFNNAEERRQFEKGIQRKDEHFNAYRTRPLSWWERLFGVKHSRRNSVDTRNREDEKRKDVYRSVKRTSSEREERRYQRARSAPKAEKKKGGIKNFFKKKGQKIRRGVFKAKKKFSRKKR